MSDVFQLKTKVKTEEINRLRKRMCEMSTQTQPLFGRLRVNLFSRTLTNHFVLTISFLRNKPHIGLLLNVITSGITQLEQPLTVVLRCIIDTILTKRF